MSDDKPEGPQDENQTPADREERGLADASEQDVEEATQSESPDDDATPGPDEANADGAQPSPGEGSGQPTSGSEDAERPAGMPPEDELSEPLEGAEAVRASAEAAKATVKQLSERFREALANVGEQVGEQVRDAAQASERVPTAAAQGPSAGGAGATDADNVVNLAAERFRRRGMSKQVDVKALLKKSFAEFVEKHGVESTEDEEGRTVTIDGEFLAKHGSEVIPELFGGLAKALLGVVQEAQGADEEIPAPEATQHDDSVVVPSAPQADADGPIEDVGSIRPQDGAEGAEADEPSQAPADSAIPEPEAVAAAPDADEAGDEHSETGTGEDPSGVHVKFDVKSLFGMLFASAAKAAKEGAARARADATESSPDADTSSSDADAPHEAGPPEPTDEPHLELVDGAIPDTPDDERGPQD